MTDRRIHTAGVFRLLISILLLGSILPVLHASPDAPSNVQVRILPAELLFTWDPSAGAAYYQVYRGGPDRRWVPLPDRPTVPRFRDTDFTDLPSYYQITAVDAAGEWAATPEFLVSNSSSNCALSGHLIRPVSDTAITIVWSIAGEPADGMLEVGVGTNDAAFFAVNTNYLHEHEFTVTNLVPSATYWFRLTSAASNRAGFSYRNTFFTQPYTEPAPIPISIVPPANFIPQTDEDRVLPLLLTADNPGGLPLQYFIERHPTRGRLLGTPPNVTYVPNINSGVDTDDYFVCAVTDGAVTNEGVIDIWLRGKNHVPYAKDDSISIAEDSAGSGELRGFDLDGSPPAYRIIVGPTNGALVLKDYWPEATFFNYFPNTNFNGIDHFTFTATDGQLTGNVATVRIRVTPVNDPPVARNQSVTVTQDTHVTITLDASDPDGTFWLSSVGSPSNGTLSGFSPFDYAPAHGYIGPDSFSYSISDGLVSTSATVFITVVPPNHAPIANDLSVSTEFNTPIYLTLSGADLDGDPLTFALVNGPAHGTVSGSGPNLTYTPASGFSGVESFTFKVNDGRADSAPGTVSLTVLPPAAPAAPSALTAIAVSRAQINLGWNDNSRNEDGFQIERSNDNRSWKLVATVGANVRSFSNFDLTGNKTYSYRVHAFNSFGNSDYSNTASAKTLR